MKEKWFFKTSVLIVALLSVGPFALPLLWFNPRYRLRTKIIATLIVLVLSYLLGRLMDSALKSIIQYYKLAFAGF